MNNLAAQEEYPKLIESDSESMSFSGKILNSGGALAHEEHLLSSVKHYAFANYLTAYDENDYEPADIIILANGPSASLRRWYEFRDDTAVENFLEENPFLVKLLFRTHEKIREYFDPSARLALKVVKDPDAQEDQELFVVIQTRLRPRAARTLLSELDQEWWLDALPEAQGKMEIALERL